MKGDEAFFYARVKVYFYIIFVFISDLLIISFDKKESLIVMCIMREISV